jgi:hypothetical protein
MEVIQNEQCQNDLHSAAVILYGKSQRNPPPQNSLQVCNLNKTTMDLNLIPCILSHYLLGYETVVRTIPLMDVIKHYSYATNG